ncbi:phage-related protein [Rhizobium sp. PP-F2F-G20b]|nr:phage-related protein [Rhizobium sp. PP-F2F-G20b]
MKVLTFCGNSLRDLRAFPDAVRREAGYQLEKVQNAQPPSEWKPMPSIGKGVQEIRVRDESGAFRVIYVARFADAVYVLHCFRKKTQKTGKTDLDLATQRYRDLVKGLDP